MAPPPLDWDAWASLTSRPARGAPGLAVRVQDNEAVRPARGAFHELPHVLAHFAVHLGAKILKGVKYIIEYQRH